MNGPASSKELISETKLADNCNQDDYDKLMARLLASTATKTLIGLGVGVGASFLLFKSLMLDAN
jgi:hypothetical protein